jgi:lactam utilization protein B
VDGGYLDEGRLRSRRRSVSIALHMEDAAVGGRSSLCGSRASFDISQIDGVRNMISANAICIRSDRRFIATAFL